MGTVFLSGGYTQLHPNIILFCTLTQDTGKPVKAQREGDWPQRTGSSPRGQEDLFCFTPFGNTQSQGSPTTPMFYTWTSEPTGNLLNPSQAADHDLGSVHLCPANLLTEWGKWPVLFLSR